MHIDDKQIEHLNQLLQARQFEEAEAHLLSLAKPTQFTRILYRSTERGAGLLSYAFCNYMIQKHGTALWHWVAACIAAESFNHLEQGRNTGLYHTLKAIELKPDEWRYKEYALSFFQEGYLSRELASQFAKDVLKYEPYNKLALKISVD